MPAAKKTTAKRATAKKTTAKRATAKKTTAKRATAKKTTAKRATKPGDVILIDSAKVGSPPREGEVLKIIQGEVSVSYWVRWADGHQSFIMPKGSPVHIVPASERA
jgi:hypothetical protein